MFWSLGRVLDSGTYFWILGSVLDSGTCFWILGGVLDFGRCFFILGRVMDSGKCFVPMRHGNCNTCDCIDLYSALVPHNYNNSVA